MQISLLSPLGAAVALVALVPLAALAFSELRARRVRSSLGLAAPHGGMSVLLGLAIVAVGALVGAAAAQPTLERGAMRHERVDVNAYVVIDSSRSMLASAGRRSATRIERARALAQELRGAVPELKVGLASMTDRVLPHLFLTLDENVFAATLERSIGIERPPPRERRRTVTDLGSLRQLGPQGFFPPTPERRIVLVLSDFETDPFSAAKLGASLRQLRLEPVFVHVWDGQERIWGGLGDAGYRPDPRSGSVVTRLAESSSGKAFAEADVDDAKRALRDLLGEGVSRPLWRESSRTELAPWLALASVLPLGFVLWRRNLP